MSNRRRAATNNRYRSSFLRSPAWFARRDRWFREEEAAGKSLHCFGCGRTETKRHLELHHLDYDGVIETDKGWLAQEAHEDLISMHPRCHELLHRILDRDAVYGSLRDRRHASLMALARLRQKLERTAE